MSSETQSFEYKSHIYSKNGEDYFVCVLLRHHSLLLLNQVRDNYPHFYPGNVSSHLNISHLSLRSECSILRQQSGVTHSLLLFWELHRRTLCYQLWQAAHSINQVSPPIYCEIGSQSRPAESILWASFRFTGTSLFLTGTICILRARCLVCETDF